ncbi:unnamed protein product, partial [Mesorhabditis spiculigera]
MEPLSESMFERDFSKTVRRLIPEQTQDKIAMFLFVFLLPAIFFGVFFMVLPTWYPVYGEAWMLRVVPILFLLASMYFNWVQMIRVGPNGINTALPMTYQAGFVFCHHCKMNAPPRSHHCPVCDVCIFRRDHHCSFAAVCVGHHNQKYFCAAIVQLFLAVFPAFAWTWVWMWSELGPAHLGRFWHLVMPHVALALRFVSVREFSYIGMCGLVFTVLLFNSYLISAQIFCFWRGQTRVEYLQDISAYNLGFMENIRQSLGSRWYLLGLFPWIPSPLESNGLSYKTRPAAKFSHSAKEM